MDSEQSCDRTNIWEKQARVRSYFVSRYQWCHSVYSPRSVDSGPKLRESLLAGIRSSGCSIPGNQKKVENEDEWIFLLQFSFCNAHFPSEPLDQGTLPPKFKTSHLDWSSPLVNPLQTPLETHLVVELLISEMHLNPVDNQGVCSFVWYSNVFT